MELHEAAQAVRVSRHSERVVHEFSIFSPFVPELAVPVRDDDCLLVLGQVQESLLDVDLLLGLHVEDEIAPRVIPVGAEVKVNEREFVFFIWFETSDFILFNLLEQLLEVFKIKITIGEDVFSLEL
jgi:hypothetical protein